MRKKTRHYSLLKFFSRHKVPVVIKSNCIGMLKRYSVSIPTAEILNKDGTIEHIYGSGDTEEIAMTVVADNISRKLIVIDNGKPTKREIETPDLVA